ncbi:Lrp/AsnC family transcriptional regulator [Streptomyces sp. BE20]|uniref:Lrp/AsnC family transcriptional regulator n=1 Tax=Streptomyces sp. BE20 TaxID=3002525 RepID=UPI002E78ADED|nr:Lrp/AsnC family transcriptional regulator [Streptomyces sp. BE20]MEE1828517.1 Lrp/AsnC family transcriptional regulator [Streptomyces sp. BE20]
MLDTTDAALVHELQRDGRVSYQRLSELLGISREAARARVQRLLQRGEVRIVGIVPPSVAGIETVAHVSLDVAGPVRAVAAMAAGRRAASFVSCTAGPQSVITEVRVADEGALEREFAALRAVPGVRGLEVFRCAELVRDAYSPVVAGVRAGPPPELDTTDRRLLGMLQLDGRASFTALAERIGLSQPATRARVLRLLEVGAVHVTGLVESRALGVREAAGVGLGVRGPARAVAEAAAALPGVNYVASGYGRFDVVCGLDAPDRPALFTGLEAVRALPGVTRSETWVHLDIVKESYTYDLPIDQAIGSPGTPLRE